ncbi:MAG: rhomboid family intramembrane serine protease [Verrucomicrobiota bacterium]
MNASSQETDDSPVWARPEAFPTAPPAWGWLDHKGKSHPCATLDALAAAIRDDRHGEVDLVWTPANPRMILPEELDGMSHELRTVREQWTRDDLEECHYRLRWFGTIFAALAGYQFIAGWLFAARQGAGIAIRNAFGLKNVFASTQVGLAVLMFIIFAFIPWWQARKRRQELVKWTEEGIKDFAPTIRFEAWLDRQKAPLTRVLLGLVLVVALTQVFGKVRTEGLSAILSLFHNWHGTDAAGLVKPLYVQGQWWRLFTAPFLHGNIVHLLMNAAAMAYLGKRVEVFARWPHLPMVFLFAATIGGAASARFIAAPSVGASGGLMGWLGFLLVFETLHKNLVPRRARRRLAAGVFLTALIGVIGYRYIDNAAHAGGLLAGMAYAAIVFPSSASPRRPRTTGVDRAAAAAALLMLVAAAGFAVVKIITG